MLVDAPAGIERTLAPLPEGATLVRGLRGRASFDVGLLFATRLARLRERFGAMRPRLAETGGLWLAWPKKASGVATDLSDEVVRRLGLTAGLVDNKVCAVDETWSGLRFVVRRADRGR